MDRRVKSSTHFLIEDWVLAACKPGIFASFAGYANGMEQITLMLRLLWKGVEEA